MLKSEQFNILVSKLQEPSPIFNIYVKNGE
jgi:hypothetical protein